MPKPFFMIAEDDPDDQFMIHEALVETCLDKIEVSFVGDGNELIERLRGRVEKHTSKPDLIILDMNMPRKNGRATLKELRETPQFSDLPVAILTTHIDPGDLDYCSRLGTVGYFRKPNTITELQIIMEELYRKCLAAMD